MSNHGTHNDDDNGTTIDETARYCADLSRRIDERGTVAGMTALTLRIPTGDAQAFLTAVNTIRRNGDPTATVHSAAARALRSVTTQLVALAKAHGIEQEAKARRDRESSKAARKAREQARIERKARKDASRAEIAALLAQVERLRDGAK